MGRRWGKTVLGGDIALPTAKDGGRVAWIVPSYKNGRPLWRWSEAVVGNLKRANFVRTDRTERLIEFPKTGGFLGIYSADNDASIRGEWFNLVVLDEAARIPETTYVEVVQPALADVDGDAILISTPKGRNWFWQEYIAAEADGVRAAAFHAPSAANPNPLIQRAAMLAKERVPDRTYQQEWLAEFIDDGGGVFRGVRRAATAIGHLKAIPGHQYAIGVDWGKHEDFTVLSVLDMTAKEQVEFDRFNHIDYTIQTQRLRALSDRFKPKLIVAERNSMGEPLIEQLQREKLPVEPFTTTNASKAEAIDALSLAFEKSDIKILDKAVQIAELEAYEMQRLPSGMLRYQAPDGMHDDCVMALALAWQAVTMPSRRLVTF